MTSTYYMEALPAWLEDWNRTRGADSYAGRRWTRIIEDESVYEAYAGPDEVEGEWREGVFPHVFPENGSVTDFYIELGQMPFADDMTLDVSLEAMLADDLGADEYVDILAIGLSGTDRVGHRTVLRARR